VRADPGFGGSLLSRRQVHRGPGSMTVWLPIGNISC
jgi:hypothetical protein